MQKHKYWENLSFTEKTIDELGIGMFITRFNRRWLEYPFFVVVVFLFVFVYILNVACTYLHQILPGRAPPLCNFDIKKHKTKANNKATPTLESLNLTHPKSSVLWDRFSVVLTWNFVFFTFSDNSLGCKGHVATQNGHMTPEMGRHYSFGETGWQSLPVTILVKLWLRGSWRGTSTET